MQEAFKNLNATELALKDIRIEIRNTTSVKIRKETITKYNAHQFCLYQTAPLEWVGDDLFALNRNYYRLLGEKVFAPRVGRRGRPKKHGTDKTDLDTQF